MKPVRAFVILLGTALCGLAGDTVSTFDFDMLRSKARALAEQPFKALSGQTPDVLRKLSYSEYQGIRFNPKGGWHWMKGSPFQVEPFHPGYVQKDLVILNELDEQRSRKIPFDRRYFDYGTNQLEVPDDFGYAGFRLVYPAKNFGEAAAFLGASYFRMLGRGQSYGTSGRGLALNTTSPEGEEFPYFREYWIRRTGRRDHEIDIYALMDSPSITGAYRFTISPGRETVASVKAALFPRREIKEFGLAPLTSMFLHDDNGHPLFQDFRPEVHDADGLLMNTSKGEWIWRPLDKGKMMRVNAYQDENPRGFGLLQRDRNFEHYQDLVAQFERRPSVWVEPVAPWGKGAVQLVQLPSDREFSDNIIAFWNPSSPPKPGGALELAYRLHWMLGDPSPPSLGHVLATRIGRVIVEPAKGPPNLRFVVDFGGAAIESLSDKEKLSVQIEHGDDAKLVADSLFKNPLNQTWRLVIEIADPGKAVDLRAFLKRNEQQITETWTFTWQP